tara:strand:- start:179 stop:727 length:549 start_codon:yes stop_codon:yes gene_type:complete
MSTLRVDNITGRLDDTTINQPITFSANTATLNSGVVFPAGHIIQIVSQLYTSAVTVSSSSYQDAGPSLAITPSSTSNKILVWTNMDSAPIYSTGVDGRVKGKLVRTVGGSATDILEQTHWGFYLNAGGNDNNIYFRQDFMMVDSPNTTSETTYKFQARTSGANHISFQNGTGSSLVLMEIKG